MSRQVKGYLIFIVILLAGIFLIFKLTGADFTGSGAWDGGGGEEIFLFNNAGAELSWEKKQKVLAELGFSFSEEELELLGDYGRECGYADLLGLIGMGNYDYETWKWSPSSSQVYALDTEVFDVAEMYPDFFRGLLSISNGELPITNVTQDDSGVDQEQGTGTVRVSLEYDGRPYSFNMTAMSDWLDCNVLKEVNDILKAEGVEKRFYATWNNMQGMTIFYCDRDWARQFERKTGCRLFTAP